LEKGCKVWFVYLESTCDWVPGEDRAMASGEESESFGTLPGQMVLGRATSAECANAQARNRGLTQFLGCSLEKIKTVAVWHVLAHNMICSWPLIET
jgi:hypothetical protein